VARTLLRRKRIVADIVCFHAQQSAEKFTKALLQEREIRFGKTHDLLSLLGLLDVSEGLSLMRDDFRVLWGFAVKTRYPGYSATVTEARNAVKAAKRIRGAILPILR
jgi:HEPN domain-containing protein